MSHKPNTGQREAEKVVIAAILKNEITPEETNLSGLEFDNPDFVNIFIASKSVRGEYGEVDINALSAYLAIHCKTADTVQPNPLMLAGLARSETPVNLIPSIKMIHQSHARKRLMDFSAGLSLQTGDETETPVEIIDRAVKQLELIRQQVGFRIHNRQHISEIVPEALEQYRELYEDGITRNITTGFVELDRVSNGGGSPGDVWIVGAFTGMGKSALALEMARRQSDKGIRSLVLSREMMNIDNFKRVHVATGNIPAWMVKPEMWKDTYDALRETIKQVAQHNIWMDARSADIETACQEIEAAVSEDGISVVYVDYLQLFRALKSGRMNRMEEIAYCSLRLKEVAMKTGAWIVEIAQYNRMAALSGQAENHSFDGASQIEKDASAILHLELEKQEKKDCIPVWRKGQIRTTKGRNMPTTDFDIWYRGETFTFTETNPLLTYYQENGEPTNEYN